MTDTIFALATAPGRGAVAVMRLSGPGAGSALEALAGTRPKARQAAVRRLRDGAGAVLDQALVLWFPAPGSYTGVDCAELHVHGGAAVIDGVTRALLARGLRLAAPGEFTRRAFENGKLDLGQAEAVADLIDAETQAQARQAIDQLGGALTRRHEDWRSGLVEALARLEAAVDFPDEDLPADVLNAVRGPLERLRKALDDALAQAGRGLRVREGYRVAVIGAPNAGKSSLFNALTGHDGAIVAATPGTTRDVIEAHLTLAGYRVLLADTAGLRTAKDAIEAEGIHRARAWSEGADLRLWVVDQHTDDGAWREAATLARAGDVCVLNKIDLPPGRDAAEVRAMAAERGLPLIALSVTAQGARIVLDELTRRVIRDSAGAEFPAATRARHVEQLQSARASLDRAIAQLSDPELAAEDVRLAARALERVTGRVGVEDVLDGLFARFCIGK